MQILGPVKGQYASVSHRPSNNRFSAVGLAQVCSGVIMGIYQFEAWKPCHLVFAGKILNRNFCTLHDLASVSASSQDAGISGHGVKCSDGLCSFHDLALAEQSW